MQRFCFRYSESNGLVEAKSKSIKSMSTPKLNCSYKITLPKITWLSNVRNNFEYCDCKIYHELYMSCLFSFNLPGWINTDDLYVIIVKLLFNQNPFRKSYKQLLQQHFILSRTNHHLIAIRNLWCWNGGLAVKQITSDWQKRWQKNKEKKNEDAWTSADVQLAYLAK